jgi:hypothetical protein
MAREWGDGVGQQSSANHLELHDNDSGSSPRVIDNNCGDASADRPRNFKLGFGSKLGYWVRWRSVLRWDVVG